MLYRKLIKLCVLMIFFQQFQAFASLVSEQKLIKVMSINVMCEFCESEDDDGFKERAITIKKIIKSHQPDLISLQELTRPSQLESMGVSNQIYHSYYPYVFFGTLPYMDTTLIFNKERFILKATKTIWLGPREGRFSLGYKASLPRNISLIKLHDKKRDQEFWFVGAHFDNLQINKKESAKKLVDVLENLSPKSFIFAGDTNIRTHDDEYRPIQSSSMIQNAYSKDWPIKLNEELCYKHKGDTFPDCRVDHVLYPQSGWSVLSWNLDTTKSSSHRFPSDHRPLIVELLPH